MQPFLAPADPIFRAMRALGAERRPAWAAMSLVLASALACTTTAKRNTASAEDTASVGDTTADSAPPCACDDGLYCNGEETCDADGACLLGTPPPPADDGDPCTLPTACDEATDTWATEPDLSAPACTSRPFVPTVDPLDYTYLYWPTNHKPAETTPAIETAHHVLTGRYGARFNEGTGSLETLGVVDTERTMRAALDAATTVVDDLPAVHVSYEVDTAGTSATATSFLGARGDRTDRAQVVEAGRFVNHLRIPTVGYAAAPATTGSVDLVSMPRHLVLSHTATGVSAARIRLSGALLDARMDATWLDTERALQRVGVAGDAWCFVARTPDGESATLRDDGAGGVVAEAVASSGSAPSITVSLLVLPDCGADPAERDLYVAPERAATVTYQLLDRTGLPVGAPVPVPWNPMFGAFLVPLGTLQQAGAPSRPDFEDPIYHRWHGRHAVTVDVAGDAELAVPLALHGSDQLSWYITGGVPMFRDTAGEPTGLPVQVSKDWHEGRPNNWYHLATQPRMRGSHTMELTMASSMWGDVFAASHAQLSLVGWSTAGAHWDESALGAFGESITYDPDMSLGRSMMDDVRPFLVDASGRWRWTGNVGGAEFLRYATLAQPTLTRRVSRVRSLYTSPGPLLTDVTYAGVSSDGRIAVEITPHLVAGDDLVRTWFDLRYTFLEDVLYDRLAFFQMATERYGDNGFTRLAWGDASGARVDTDVVADGTIGYDQPEDRGILLEGDEPWVFLYANAGTAESLPEEFGNVGFVVRAFEADIGGTIVDVPRVSLYAINNNGHPQVSFELSLPYEDGAPWCGAACRGQTTFVPAGSTVHAVVEYVVPPSRASAYYGPSTWLTGLDPTVWDGSDMMTTLARDGSVDLDVRVGTLRASYPPSIDAADGAIAAEFTRTGGLGSIPLTVQGLVRHDGWVLERLEGTSWEAVRWRGAVTNEGWQATQDAESPTLSLVYSLPDEGNYRVRWQAE